MALVDSALYGIESFEDLCRMSIPSGDDALPLRWKDEILQVPIVRNATKAGGVTNTPLPKATFEKILKSVLNLSGYYGNTTVHAIRRSLGKKLDGKLTSTSIRISHGLHAVQKGMLRSKSPSISIRVIPVYMDKVTWRILPPPMDEGHSMIKSLNTITSNTSKGSHSSERKGCQGNYRPRRRL